MFTGPSFADFTTLMAGWVMCVGRRPVSRVIQFGSAASNGRHRSAFYRFFSRAVWDPDKLGERIWRYDRKTCLRKKTKAYPFRCRMVQVPGLLRIGEGRG